MAVTQITAAGTLVASALSVNATINLHSPITWQATAVLAATANLSSTLVSKNASPDLVQFVTSSSNPEGIGVTGNNFKFALPNAVGAGNCLILQITFTSGLTATVTDNNGNTWPAAAVSADAGAGLYKTSIYVLPNANAGVTTITVGFGSAFLPFQYTIAEYTHIATSSPVNGTQSSIIDTGSALAVGSFTPNANIDGNLILAFFAPAQTCVESPTDWVPGGSFTLLEGDIAWTGVGNSSFPHAAMALWQVAPAAINPQITATGDTTNTYNCLAVALKTSANAGTAKPAGIHIDKILHFSNDVPPATTWPLKIPAVGNLRLITSVQPNNDLVVSSVTDNDSNTWTYLGDNCQVWYMENQSPNPNLIVTIHMTAQAQTLSIRFYDISGAAAAAFEKIAIDNDINVNNLTTISNHPNITPNNATDLVIAIAGCGVGPGLSVTSPAGAIFDLVTYSGEVDNDLMENADLAAHLYNAGTSLLHWNWTITSQPSNTSSALAIIFKAPSSVTAWNGTAVFAATASLTAGTTQKWVTNPAVLAGASSLAADAWKLKSFLSAVLAANSSLIVNTNQIWVTNPAVLAATSSLAANAWNLKSFLSAVLAANYSFVVNTNQIWVTNPAVLAATASLIANATLAGSVTTWQGSAVLAAASTLTANALDYSPAVAVLAATSSLIASTAQAWVTNPAVLAAASSFTADAFKLNTAVLAATSSLIANTKQIWVTNPAVLAAASSFTADAFKLNTAVLAATSSLIALAQQAWVTNPATLPLNSGLISATQVWSFQNNALLAATAAFYVNATQVGAFQATAVLSAAGTFVANATQIGKIQASAVLPAGSSLAAASFAQHQGSALLAATSTLDAATAILQRWQAQAVLPAASTLSATTAILQRWQAQAVLPASSTVAAAAVQRYQALAKLIAGSGINVDAVVTSASDFGHTFVIGGGNIIANAFIPPHAWRQQTNLSGNITAVNLSGRVNLSKQLQGNVLTSHETSGGSP